jgi:cell filamentation protein
LDDCYPGTTVLVNKFGIRDEAILNEVETNLVTSRAVEWETEPRCASFDFFHYRAINEFLFSELYDWAGKTRSVNLSKQHTTLN